MKKNVFKNFNLKDIKAIQDYFIASKDFFNQFEKIVNDYYNDIQYKEEYFVNDSLEIYNNFKDKLVVKK